MSRRRTHVPQRVEGSTDNVGVPVGVGNDPAVVELGAVGQQQRRQRIDPVAVAAAHGDGADRSSPGRVRPGGRQQRQLTGRGGGVAGFHPSAGRGSAARSPL